MLAGGIVGKSMAARIGKSSVSTPFDQAWTVLKAVEFDTQAKRGSRPFKAYRVIPRKYLDEVLSEGFFPRDASQWRVSGFPDMTRQEMRALREKDSDAYRDVMNHPTDKALWSFMHQRGYGPNSNALARMRRDNPYSSRSHPALAARYFGDRFMTVPAEDFNIETGRNADNVAIVGSKIAPPGKRFVDMDFEPMETAAKPTISFEPIEPRYLDEAIPIDNQGRELRYTRGSEIPDVLRDDWGFDE